MSKFKETLKSPHIHISLATGISIIVLAYFSKRVLSEPMGYLSLAIPPFFMTIWEALLSKNKYEKICKTWYWIAAILIATVLVIVWHAI